MAEINKATLTEADIISKYLLPAIKAAGWDDLTQVRQEVKLRDGKVVVRGQMAARKKVKSADIVLYHKMGLPLAVIEAKANKHEIGKGMQQGLDYARLLDVPFVFASNGDGFVFHDKTNPAKLESEIALEDFPSPGQLWDKLCTWKGYTQAQLPVISQDYYSDGSGKSPRYYQLQAINKTVEAISKGEDRVLLVMATGTGKTYTAFQIIWRLWKAGAKKRILFWPIGMRWWNKPSVMIFSLLARPWPRSLGVLSILPMRSTLPSIRRSPDQKSHRKPSSRSHPVSST